MPSKDKTDTRGVLPEDLKGEVLEKEEVLDGHHSLGEEGVTRRGFLLLSGAAAGSLVGASLLLTGCPEDEEEATTTTTAAEGDTSGEAGVGVGGSENTFVLTTLAVSEAEALEALLARMIPNDDVGPGAVEAGVVRYIDRTLGSEAGAEMDFLRVNLAAVDEYALQEQNLRFTELEPDVQEELIGAIERGEAEGFAPGSAEFFGALRELVLQGMFGDPFYGGNIDNAGWDLLSYPGVRIDVPADAQELDADPPAGESSTYNFELFGLQRPQEG